jgi:hypothetical protein
MKDIFKSKGKWVISISLVVLMVMGIVGSVSAAEFPKGETIPATETIDDDVFISGTNVVVDGTINGILFAIGQTVTVNGSVNGDAILMGETIVVSDSAVIDGNLFVGSAQITVNGTVTGSVFGGSSAMEFGSSANVARNLFYGGFSLTTDKNSQVGKDLYAGAYQSLLSGSIARDLSISSAAVELNGSVGRNATIDVGDVKQAEGSVEFMSFNPGISKYVKTVVEPGIRVSDSASIAGKLTYTSSVEETQQLQGITSGAVIYQTPVPYEDQTKTQPQGQFKNFKRGYPAGYAWGTAALSVLSNFIKLMALGALALWLLAKPFKQLVNAAYEHPWKSMGWGFVVIAVGFLAVIIVPLVFIMVGVILGFLSLGGLLGVWFGLIGTTLMLAFMLFFFAAFTFSNVLAAFMFGKWLMKALFKQTEEKVWLNLLVGVFLYVLIRSIPMIGWLAALAATLIGTGAFWLALPQKKA